MQEILVVVVVEDPVIEALVITGLGGSDPDHIEYIISSLESKGYEVTEREYRSFDIDYDREYAIVVAHSAGSGQAQAYASRHPDSTVYILGSPVDFNGDNVVSVTQWYDPISVIGSFFDSDESNNVNAGGWPHSSKDMYKAIEDDIENV